MTAAVGHITATSVAFWIGLLIVAGCLIAAAAVLYRSRDWFVALILCVIALVAAVLLL